MEQGLICILNVLPLITIQSTILYDIVFLDKKSLNIINDVYLFDNRQSNVYNIIIRFNVYKFVYR